MANTSRSSLSLSSDHFHDAMSVMANRTTSALSSSSDPASQMHGKADLTTSSMSLSGHSISQRIATPKASLLSLPTELRLDIYQQVVSSIPETVEISPCEALNDEFNTIKFKTQERSVKDCVSLLLTCSAIYKEFKYTAPTHISGGHAAIINHQWTTVVSRSKRHHCTNPSPSKNLSWLDWTPVVCQVTSISLDIGHWPCNTFGWKALALAVLSPRFANLLKVEIRMNMPESRSCFGSGRYHALASCPDIWFCEAGAELYEWSVARHVMDITGRHPYLQSLASDVDRVGCKYVLRFANPFVGSRRTTRILFLNGRESWGLATFDRWVWT